MSANAVSSIFVPGDMLAIALGADELVKELQKQTKDRNISIEIIRNGSRGMCWAETLLEVQTNAGRVAYGNVKASDVNSLFAADFLNGGKHEKSLGLTEDIPWLTEQERVIFNRCGIIDPLSLEEFQDSGGFAGLRKALQMSPVQIVEQVTKSGLRGRGGAGFPTGIKWQTVLDTTGAVKHIVCNADEGDSGTFSDRLIMEGDPFRLIEGMVIAGLAVGAEQGVIYLRSEYPFAVKMMRAAIEIAVAESWLGGNIQGSGKTFDMEVFVGAGSYVCGEETALLESLEGKTGIVRSKPPLPAIAGLFGQPTVINNVITLCAVPDILAKGGDWHASLGIGRSTGTLPFQLAGNVAKGGLVELPFGASLQELVSDFAGGTKDGSKIRAVQVGGPLGAYLPPELFDTLTGYEEFASIGAGIGHGGIVIYGSSINMREQAKYAFEFCAEESCGKCTPCRIGSIRGYELLGAEQIDKSLIDDLCEVMIEGSACAMGAMTPIPVQSAMRYWPEDFKGKS
ncbi:MAG: formate dehydrogenase [Robiginitomaculum sp.]|nr:formate dehydrogenase [Robiginitomaculum sp.]